MKKTTSMLVCAGLLAVARAAFAQDPMTPPPPPPAPPVYTAPVVHEDAPKETGFVFAAHLSTNVLSVGAFGANINVGTLQGGFLVGYKLQRIILGLGLDILRSATGTSVTGQPDQSEAETALLVKIGGDVAILQSSDQRVQLVGALALGFGHLFGVQSQPNMDRGNFRFQYEVAPGVRLWVHPQFAITGFAGVRGDFEFDSTTNTMSNVTQSNSSAITSIFATLQLLGVF